MIINHNISALNTQRVQGLNDTSSAKVMERLSSGERINRAADDAAGLAISEKMRAQIAGLNQASRNIQDGVSFIQATEGHLNETVSIIQRLRMLAIQSANGIYQDEERRQIQVEVSQLVAEVNRVASQAQFNGMNMLNGMFAGEVPVTPAENGQADSPVQSDGGLVIHVGANTDQNSSITIQKMDATSLGINELKLTSADSSNNAIGVLDKALSMVSMQRSDLGAYQNRLVEAGRGVDVASENLQAAESRIRDANMADEVVDFTRDQIKSQAAIAMLVQANLRPQQILQLLN